MIRSANELSAVVAKAARGAGLPLGLAEDLAAAIPAHATGKLDSTLTALLRHLSAPAALLAHVSALDAAEAVGAAYPTVSCPCLQSVTAQRVNASAHAGPHEVSADIWHALEAQAARTYVPETEASRRAGAGAGLTDND